MIRKPIETIVLFVCMMAVSSFACLEMGANFWNVAWQPVTDYVSGTTSNYQWGNWSPTFISQIQSYSCLRFMDWNVANRYQDGRGGGNWKPTWAGRTKKSTICTQCIWSDSAIAFEWQIDMINRVPGCTYWINVPRRADSLYIDSLARLTHSLLNPGHKLILEYANETWWEPASWAFLDSVGNSLKFKNTGAGPIVNGISGIPSYLGDVYESAKMWRIFRKAWKQEGGDPSYCQGVLTGPACYGGGYFPAWDIKYDMGALLSDTVNPSHEKCEFFAIAPYFECSNPLRDELPEGCIRDHYIEAQKWGVQLITYEEGPSGSCDSVHMTQHFAMLEKYCTLYCQYTHSGGQWGATNNGYFQAIAGWAKNHNKCGSTMTKEPYQGAMPNVSSKRPALSLANTAGDIFGLDGRRIDRSSIPASKSKCFIVALPGSGYSILMNM
jgi:hypothetical protein